MELLGSLEQERALNNAGAVPNPKRSHVPEVGAGGYGMPYMPPMVENRLAGEMRSANEFPLSDFVAEKTGSPLAGVVTDKVAKLGRATGDTLAGMTMMPWAYQTGSDLGETAARKGIIPSAAASEGPDKLQQLLETQAVLRRQAEEARARRESFRPKGGRPPSPQSDPQYTAADQEFRQFNDQLNAHSELVKEEQNLRSPEHQLKMKQAKDKADEDKRAREAATPWRERNEALAKSLPNYAIAVSAGVPAAIATLKNARSFFPGSVQGQTRTAISENMLARSTNDAPTAALTEAELRNLLKEMPTWKTDLLSASKAAGAGGAISAEAAMYPDQVDAYNLPEGEAKKRARDLALNPLAYLERGGMGALTGFSGYEIGANLTPWRGANTSRAKAITDNPYVPPAAPIPPPAGAGPGPAAPQGGGLPPGVKRDVNGVAYDAHTGQKIKKRLFEGRE